MDEYYEPNHFQLTSDSTITIFYSGKEYTETIRSPLKSTLKNDFTQTTAAKNWSKENV